MSEEWTIQKLLTWITDYLTQRQVDAPRLSAELLLSHVLGLRRIDLYVQFSRVVEKEQLTRLRELTKRAGLHEPVAYLVGRTEFYSLEIEVTRDCLIPRPETELLVQRTIEFLRTREGPQYVCDLCAGSGCIAVAVAKNVKDAKVVGADISAAALAVAARNVAKHQLQDRVQLYCGDLFDALVPHVDVTSFDVVASNPPYVSTADYEKLDKNVKDYEPKEALLAGPEGLDGYRRILERIDPFLKSGGGLFFEISYAQGQSVPQLVEQTGLFSDVKVEKDVHGNDRLVTARKK
jgi:release factor glutamine methyltransferase